ncbi:hypothetical protein BgiBS90_005358 [Biomphalaria glabrata]|nr:hypothetical protein BgiBS90_005358 [Biomphalaria glabrata]
MCDFLLREKLALVCYAAVVGITMFVLIEKLIDGFRLMTNNIRQLGLKGIHLGGSNDQEIIDAVSVVIDYIQRAIAHLNLSAIVNQASQRQHNANTTPTQRQRAIVTYHAYNSDLTPVESQACVPNTGEEHHTDNSISRHTKRTQRDSSQGTTREQ